MTIKYTESLMYNKCVLHLDSIGIVEVYNKQEIGHDLYKKTYNMKVE